MLLGVDGIASDLYDLRLWRAKGPSLCLLTFVSFLPINVMLQ